MRKTKMMKKTKSGLRARGSGGREGMQCTNEAFHLGSPVDVKVYLESH